MTSPQGLRPERGWRRARRRQGRFAPRKRAVAYGRPWRRRARRLADDQAGTKKRPPTEPRNWPITQVERSQMRRPSRASGGLGTRRTVVTTHTK